MLASPSVEPSERRLSDIDRFCIQTQQTGKAEAARRVRFIATTLGIVCLALLVGLALALWRADAIAQERDALFRELRTERDARIKATLGAKDVEMNAATYALDTRVRRDIVDERMREQEQRSIELEQLAKEVERQKLVAADCLTPRSLLVAGGL